MLFGLVGLTAIVSSDSFRCRWLMSTLAGMAAAAATVPAAGVAAAAAAAGTAAGINAATSTIGNKMRRIINPSPLLDPQPQGHARCVSRRQPSPTAPDHRDPPSSAVRRADRCQPSPIAPDDRVPTRRPRVV